MWITAIMLVITAAMAVTALVLAIIRPNQKPQRIDISPDDDGAQTIDKLQTKELFVVTSMAGPATTTTRSTTNASSTLNVKDVGISFETGRSRSTAGLRATESVTVDGASGVLLVETDTLAVEGDVEAKTQFILPATTLPTRTAIGCESVRTNDHVTVTNVVTCGALTAEHGRSVCDSLNAGAGDIVAEKGAVSGSNTVATDKITTTIPASDALVTHVIDFGGVTFPVGKPQYVAAPIDPVNSTPIVEYDNLVQTGFTALPLAGVSDAVIGGAGGGVTVLDANYRIVSVRHDGTSSDHLVTATSTDYGAHWTEATTMLTSATTEITIGGEDTCWSDDVLHVVYAATTGMVVRTTSNAGDTWSPDTALGTANTAMNRVAITVDYQVEDFRTCVLSDPVAYGTPAGSSIEVHQTGDQGGLWVPRTTTGVGAIKGGLGIATFYDRLVMVAAYSPTPTTHSIEVDVGTAASPASAPADIVFGGSTRVTLPTPPGFVSNANDVCYVTRIPVVTGGVLVTYVSAASGQVMAFACRDSNVLQPASWVRLTMPAHDNVVGVHVSQSQFSMSGNIRMAVVTSTNVVSVWSSPDAGVSWTTSTVPVVSANPQATPAAHARSLSVMEDSSAHWLLVGASAVGLGYTNHNYDTPQWSQPATTAVVHANDPFPPP